MRFCVVLLTGLLFLDVHAGVTLKSTRDILAGNGNALAYGLHVDRWGNTILAGIVNENYLTVRKYDRNWNLLASYRRPEPLNYYYSRTPSSDVTSDELGNIYVISQIIAGSGASQEYNIWIGKLSPNLTLLASTQINGPGAEAFPNSFDEGRGVACDGNGNLYACGKYEDGGKYSIWLARYSTADLVKRAERVITTPGVSWCYDQPWDIAVAPDRSVVVVGTQQANLVGDTKAHVWIGRFDANLTPLANLRSTNLVGKAFGVAVESQGNILVTGTTGTTENPFVARFTPSLQQIGTQLLGSYLGISSTFGASGSYGTRLLTLPDGRILVTGRALSGSQTFFVVECNNALAPLSKYFVRTTGMTSIGYEMIQIGSSLWVLNNLRGTAYQAMLYEFQDPSSAFAITASVSSSMPRLEMTAPAPSIDTATLQILPGSGDDLPVNAPDARFVLEGSTDLVNWTPLETVSGPLPTSQPIVLQNPDGGLSPQRFYRLSTEAGPELEPLPEPQP